MGNGNFRPPKELTPLNRSVKNCHRWLRRRPLRLCQIRCISVHGGLLGTWVKYNQNYFYLYRFWETHLQVRPVDGFSPKSKNRHISASVWQILTNLARWWSSTLLTAKNLKFRKSKTAAAAILKNRHISAVVRAILTKIGTVTQFDPLDRSDR